MSTRLHSQQRIAHVLRMADEARDKGDHQLAEFLADYAARALVNCGDAKPDDIRTDIGPPRADAAARGLIIHQ